MKSAARRVALETVGWVLVIAGIAALVLPGPGLLAIFAGLVLLSQQYDWAEKRVEPVKERALKAAAESVETWPRIVLSTLIALAIIAAGVLWIWHPPARRGGRSTRSGGSSAGGAPGPRRSRRDCSRSG
jgi:uncharacterized protein (TIGR02611 family)